MNRFYRYMVFEFRGTAVLTPVVISISFLALFKASDIINTGLAVPGIDSQLQLFGMLALFILMPSWLLASFVVTQRHAVRLAGQLDPALPTDFSLAQRARQLPGRAAAIGAAAGLVYALAFNVPTDQLGKALSGDVAIITICLGQLVVWTSVGFLLAVRLHVGNLFYRAGEAIDFSLFEQGSLAPFARTGMLDVAIIVGSMAIATVQSLDAQFRVENYLSALLVAIPAAAALMLRPMWSLHRRLRARKLALLRETNSRIASLPESGDDRILRQLEMLLQRRDRIASTPTWPLDIGVWSRLALYVLIPPLAWAGAAVMEVVVSRWLGA